MNEFLLENAKEDVQIYLIDVEEFSEDYVDEFIASLDEEDFEELLKDGEVDHQALLTRYKEFRAYTLDEIRRILEHELRINVDSREVVEFMGGYEEQQSFCGASLFFPEAEADGMSVKILIAKSVAAMVEMKVERYIQ